MDGSAVSASSVGQSNECNDAQLGQSAGRHATEAGESDSTAACGRRTVVVSLSCTVGHPVRHNVAAAVTPRIPSPSSDIIVTQACRFGNRWPVSACQRDCSTCNAVIVPTAHAATSGAARANIPEHTGLLHRFALVSCNNNPSGAPTRTRDDCIKMVDQT